MKFSDNGLKFITAIVVIEIIVTIGAETDIHMECLRVSGRNTMIATTTEEKTMIVGTTMTDEIVGMIIEETDATIMIGETAKALFFYG